MKDIILLPTYNEKNNIAIIIKEIFRYYPAVEIIVIDDNSPDGTASVVKNLMPGNPNLSIIERECKNGLGAAYKDAIKTIVNEKQVRAVITMDADGSHNPFYIKELLYYIKEFDLVIGSRYVGNGRIENWEKWRMLLSKFGNLYAKILIGSSLKDLTAGFTCVRRELLERVSFDEIGSIGYAYLIEFKYQCEKKLGAKIKEIPIIFESRRGGESKISSQIIWEGLKTPLRIFLRKIWKQ